jgi:hypothetical protein
MQHQDVSGHYTHMTIHILVRQLGNEGKQKETILLYYLQQGSIADLTSSMKDHTRGYHAVWMVCHAG